MAAHQDDLPSTGANSAVRISGPATRGRTLDADSTISGWIVQDNGGVGVLSPGAIQFRQASWL